MNENQVVAGEPKSLPNIFFSCNIKCHCSNDDIAASTSLLSKLYTPSLTEKQGRKLKASEELSSNT